MVGCNGYRQPSLYAKIASTVDVASHGRLYAGLGAGWYEHKWRAYGYEWPEVPRRMGAFREAVEIVYKMWTENKPVYAGKHYHIDKPINQPRRKPRFWLGGGGEKVTLKLVAKYADGCNVGNGDAALIRRKLAVLRDHCEREGRDYATIATSTTIEVSPSWSTADTAARVEQVVAAGCDYVLFYIPRLAYDHEPLHRFASDLIPQFG